MKDKILDQVYKGAPFSQRPAADSLDLGTIAFLSLHLSFFLTVIFFLLVCCLFKRVAFRSSGPPHSVRRRCHRGGSGSLEKNQHTAALQGSHHRSPITSLLRALHFLFSSMFLRFQTEQQSLWFLAARAQEESIRCSRLARVRTRTKIRRVTIKRISD